MSETTAEQGQPIKKSIVIVDDHPMLRRGLSSLIESEPDLQVCGEAGSFVAATEMVRDMQPDLVIVDIGLAGHDGLQLVKDLRVNHSSLPVLVLSMHDETVYAARAFKAGARGYVTKQQLDDTVLLAMRQVLAGGTYMSETLKAHLAMKFVGGEKTDVGSPVEMLTDRELQVFGLVGDGRSTRQIAVALELSIKTIESHLEHIKQKLDLESAAQLAQRATHFVNRELDNVSKR